ncbi:MAG: YigZ family protein [Thermoanaerobaculia bacterium]|nr:YigZ family protein [Thermoanaerobaculia bacterium]
MIDFDEYALVAGEARATVKIQRSEFIGVAFPAPTQEAFDSALARISREHFDATHHCWAWRRVEGDELRSHGSDAGEPSGTAGRPILQAIESAGLLDTGVVVVRYYGGVKLGTGGLARAYRDAAREVLDAAQRERRILYDRVVVEVPFSAMSAVYRLVAPPDIVLVSETFGEPNSFELDVRRSRSERFIAQLEEKRIAARRG